MSLFITDSGSDLNLYTSFISISFSFEGTLSIINSSILTYYGFSLIHTFSFSSILVSLSVITSLSFGLISFFISILIISLSSGLITFLS